MRCLWMALLIQTVGSTAPASGSIVQFLVFAEHQSEVVDVFPGASVDYTWNNVFVVTVWTDDPSKSIPRIQSTLDAATNLRVLVAPYTLDVATQRWLQYNILWILMLALTFIGGCVCGAVLIGNCCGYKNGGGRRQRGCRAPF